MKSSATRKDDSQDVNMSDQLEVRFARIESHVEHINEVVTDLRVEQRRTNDKIDKLRDETNRRFEGIDKRFEGVDKRLDEQRDSLSEKIDALKDKFHSATVWALLLYIALAGTLLGVMAKGFKWI